MGGTAQLQRQRAALFRRQKGRCHWCGCEMVQVAVPRRASPPRNLCTIDHLDDRFSPDRGKRFGEYRRVAACWECNNRRGNERQAARPIDELHARSGRGLAKRVAP